jgi:bla regulator protein blaR1
VENISRDVLQPMMQAMLEDRFKLKIHRESKELPIYALLTGKTGMKMKVAESSENRPMMRMGRGQVTGKQMDMGTLALNLSNQLGRQVIDKTELKGKYDFELNWTPDETQSAAGPFGGGGPQPPPVSSESSGPTIFTALQEQLGLKLESQKGPVPMIVVDSVEKPTEN